MQATSGGVTTARMAVIDRLEIATAVVAELKSGKDGERATLVWEPSSLRGTPPGEVRLLVKCGELEVRDAIPCPPPTTPAERTARAMQERQLGLRDALLRTVLSKLVGASTSAAAPAAAAPTAEGEASGGASAAILRVLRVARKPISVEELANRTGFKVEALKKVMPGMKVRGKIAPKGKERGSSGHMENLWVVGPKGLES